MIPLQVDHVRQVTESTGHGCSIPQFSPHRKALLEEGAGLRDGSPVAGGDRQRIERDGDAPVIF